MVIRSTALAMVLAMLGCDGDKTPYVYPDAPHLFPDGNVAFLQPCNADSDCASGNCISFGSEKRCSRPCSVSAPCPAFSGWTCSSQSFCQCSFTGKQPTVCNVDGDCDGVADRPVTKEACDDEDNDCNGKVDDVTPGTSGALQYFRDVDGDGFGDASVNRWSCKPEAGWVTQGSDCDDTRKTDNPDATELCGDAFDNDCDGLTEDIDICGLIPIVVPDVNGSYASATLKACGTTPGLLDSLDITEILGKQDKTAIKFTVRLMGKPAISSCTSYTLHLGDPQQTGFDLVYIYRPGTAACGTTPSVEAYLKGQPITSTVVTAFNAASPGHVSFILEKTEIFPQLPSPTYKLKVCVNQTADRTKDITVCTEDSCEVPVHR